MLRKIAFPASLAVLMTCGGCYPNRAVYDPFSFAPKSPSNTWKPPPSVRPMPLTDDPPELPVQLDPFSLGELIDIALQNNVQTKITWAQARSAAASYGQSQSQFFPAFTGSGSYTRARQPNFLTTDALAGSTSTTPITVSDFYYSQYGPQLQISYLVFDFGTLRATSEASRQALYNADWTHNDAILLLLQTIMNDFYNYLYQKQLLVAYQSNVETAALTLDAA
ncbi:MAG: TolC family protein, partial [Verrucomicrobia bacterium]|nr:TolC family protein [Verrucomicrobiota bacterium]